MRQRVLIATIAIISGLFVAGQGLAAMGQGGGMSESDHNSSMSGQMHEGTQMHESTQMHEGTQMHERTMTQNLNRDQIRELQRILNGKGFKAGQEDGRMGMRTRQAIRQFQRSEKLTQTGHPDQETLRALAPSAEKQEFFGLSPSFGEKQEPMQHHEMEQHQEMEQHRDMEQHQEMEHKQPMEQPKTEGGSY